MISRRRLLKSISSVPVLGGIAGLELVSGNSAQAMRQTGLTFQRDLFKELGLRTFINCAGPITSMSGCLLPEEVLHAMNHAATEYVDLDELQDRVGERIANLLDCEAAVVSSGCNGAMTIGLAGIISGMEQKVVDQLPDLAGLKDHVILQESHMDEYCCALTCVGAKLVQVKTREDLEQAINEKTAMLWFLNKQSHHGDIKHEEWVTVGKKHGIATMNDCASDIPPAENLFKYTKMGFDLVAFSGGKGLRGPQSAGLLLGRKKYIEAARLHTPPRTNLGRGMKVNKEEIMGMLVALETYLAKDHAEEWHRLEAQVKYISDGISSIKGVHVETYIPDIANQVPTLRISWDKSKETASPDEIRNRLKFGHPSIQTRGTEHNMEVSTWMMEPGQERVVAARLREVLQDASN